MAELNNSSSGEKTRAEKTFDLIKGLQRCAHNICAITLGVDQDIDYLQSATEHDFDCVNSFADLVGSQPTKLLDIADNLAGLSLRMNRKPAMLKRNNTRDSLAMAIEALIAVFDSIDGDPDSEPNADEQDGNGSEGAWIHLGYREPKSLISDPDSRVNDYDRAIQL